MKQIFGNNGKRIMAATIAAVLIFSLMACGDKNGVNNNQSSAETEESKIQDNAAAAGEKEEVTIDIFMDSAGENPMTAGIQEDPVAMYIKEQTGVTLNVVLFSNEKQQAMAASGDLYDVSRMGIQYILPLIQAGAVQSLDDYLEYAPGMAEGFPEMVNYSKGYLSNGENKMYAVCARGKNQPSPLANSRYGNFIRWEWYKEAGSPEINSIDDFLKLLKTIQENHPQTESGKKTYGISRFNDWGMNHTLSDPETYTQKNEDYSQKINEGQVFYSSMEWDFDNANSELAKNGGVDKFVDVPFADTADFPSWVSRASEFGMSARTFVVSTKCDETKMKAIMRLFDFVFSEDGARTIMNGPKGITWDYDENGVAVFTEDCKEKMKENPDYLLEQGANRYLGLVGQDYDALSINEANKDQYIDLRLNSEFVKENMTKADKDYCDFYGVEVPIEVSTKRENQSTIHEGYINLMPAENPTNIQRSVTKISDYLQQAIPAMVLSNSREEYEQKYAEIHSELKNLGYDEVTAYYKEAWDNAKTNYKQLTEK